MLDWRLDRGESRRVAQAAEDYPELRTLRLCLRHAGGGGYWFEESRTSHPYDFSTEILYRSDWFMPMIAGSDRVNCMNAFKAAILHVRPNVSSTKFL